VRLKGLRAPHQQDDQYLNLFNAVAVLQVRMNAAWVLATCANQNPVVQQQVYHSPLFSFASNGEVREG